MTQGNQTYLPGTRVARKAREDDKHKCNFFCRKAEGIHCDVLYTATELHPDDVALVDGGGRRLDIIERRLAPEVPPINPKAPECGEYAFRYYLWVKDPDNLEMW